MPRTLAQNATYINETIKPAIKSAIEAQGVTVPSTDSFLDYADRIAEIEGGGSGYQLKDLPTGSISTVNDAAELPLNALKVSVDAQQDLHGYDHPWVGGAGKNKLPLVLADIKSANTSGTWSGDTYTVNGVSFEVNTDDGGNVTSVAVKGTPSATTTFSLYDKSNIAFPFQSTFYIANGCPSGGGQSTNYKFDGLYYTGGSVGTLFTDTGTEANRDYSPLSNADRFLVRIVIYQNATLPLIFYPMIRLETEASATFVPYSNICPIEGWDSGSINVASAIIATTLKDDGVYASNNGVFIPNSPPNVKTYAYAEYNCNGSQQFEIKISNPGSVNAVLYYNNDTFINSERFDNQNELVFTTPSNSTRFIIETGGTTTPRNATTVGAWELRKINTYTLSFPQTIYGAEWDVVNGEMDNTFSEKINLGDLTWASQSFGTGSIFTSSNLPYAVKHVSNTEPINGRCEAYQTKAYNQMYMGAKGIGGFYNSTMNLCINDDSYERSASGAAQLKSDLDGIYLIFERQTPTTIQLSPLSIRMLQGTNNLYADCGEVIEGEYFSGSAKGYVDGIKYAGEGDGGIASYTNIKSADELLGATAITFEVYARIDSYVSKTSGAYARLMEFGNSQQTGRLGFIGLASDNDNNLCYWDDTADIASGIDTWTLGDTHLVSIVKTTAGALKIYVDGVLKYTGSSTLSITTSIIDYVTERGGYSSQVDSARQLNGEVYAWRVYAKELSAANIAQNLAADRSLYAR